MTTLDTIGNVAPSTVVRSVRAPGPRPNLALVPPAGPRPVSVDWPTLAMILCSCLFIGAFATYILFPAVRTVSTPAAHNPVHPGP